MMFEICYTGFEYVSQNNRNDKNNQQIVDQMKREKERQQHDQKDGQQKDSPIDRVGVGCRRIHYCCPLFNKNVQDIREKYIRIMLILSILVRSYLIPLLSFFLYIARR